MLNYVPHLRRIESPKTQVCQSVVLRKIPGIF